MALEGCDCGLLEGRHCTDFCLERLKEPAKNLIQDSL